MLEYVERSVSRFEIGRPRHAGAESLLMQLRQHRVRPRLIATPRGVASCGLPLRVSVQQYLCAPPVAADLHDRLREAVAAGLPVTLALNDFENQVAVETSLEAFCVAVRRALNHADCALDLLGLCLRSHMIPLQAYLVITSVLGKGPRYVMLDSLQMQQHADKRVQAVTEANWLELWHRRQSDCAARAVYSESVRSRCPLLADEKTASILPALDVPVPADSAWLPLEIFLPDYSDGHGHLHIPTLRSALHACLDINDEISSQILWPCERQQRDSETNNRIALLLTGIGDLVIERQLDPSEIRSLRWVEKIISAVQSEVWEYSAAIARRSETLPSLLQSDPSNVWQNAQQQQEWSERWQKMLQEKTVRNRNLLVLSPYSVLPRQRKISTKFTDLLPVLAHADAISFRGLPALSSWKVRDFSSFHQRAWAVITRECRRTRIAAGA
jgi:hypothetical protein